MNNNIEQLKKKFCHLDFDLATYHWLNHAQRLSN